jgi:hypothetical protein
VLRLDRRFGIFAFFLVWHPSSLRLIISFSFTGSDPLKVSELGSPVVNSAYSIASKRIDSQKLICAPCLVLRWLVAIAMPSTARDKMPMVLMFYSLISVYMECKDNRNDNHCERFVNANHLLMLPGIAEGKGEAICHLKHHGEAQKPVCSQFCAFCGACGWTRFDCARPAAHLCCP